MNAESAEQEDVEFIDATTLIAQDQETLRVRTSVAAEALPTYDQCMSWCTQSYDFFTCDEY